MFRKKFILNQCQRLQNQIQDLQSQINELRSEHFIAEVIDSSGKVIMLPEGYFQSNPPGYGYYNYKPYPKKNCVSLKQVIEAITEKLDLKIEVLEQSPSKVVVRGK